MPRPKDDSKVKQIQDATRHLVIRTGFSGLKMSEVAKEAGIATGTLYIYYKNKEELINDLYVMTKKEINASILTRKNQADTVYASFRNMWFAFFKYNFQNPEKMLFVEQFKHSGLITVENLAYTDQLLAPLHAFLDEAKRQGLVKEISNELLLAQIEGSIHEVVKVMIKNQTPFSKSLCETIFEMTWNGVRR